MDIERLARSAAVELARNAVDVAKPVRNAAVEEQLRSIDVVVEPGSQLVASADNDSMERPSEPVGNIQLVQPFAAVEHGLESGKIFEVLRSCKILN